MDRRIAEELEVRGVIIRGRFELRPLGGGERWRGPADEDDSPCDTPASRHRSPVHRPELHTAPCSGAVSDQRSDDDHEADPDTGLPEEEGIDDETQGTDPLQSQQQSSPYASTGSPARKYPTRERATPNYASQMCQIAYPQRYRQYHKWQPRPARVAPTRAKRTTVRHCDRTSPETSLPDNSIDNLGGPGGALEFASTHRTSPHTPVGIGFGLATPQTRPRLSPGWESTTASQIGEPYTDMDVDIVQPVYRDSIVEAYNNSELPQQTNLTDTRITSSPLVRCETESADIRGVQGVQGRRIVGMEVRSLEGGRLKFRKVTGPIIDWKAKDLGDRV